ncbi:hypothetical protein CRM94_17490 [Burkholderia gladioli]|uniref:Uncharacterized protein n=1 Tax=Burkholderia gladioli TaxID=28095 RepID=A0A2A7SAB3_BURGA|nr:hypothetical protein [Burkholderia gladioli]PEH40501.1 hypothetical protein CRM94_17490 [Burkholderia gladioli]
MLDYFIEHANSSLSVAELMTALPEYRSSQIAHALSALLVSKEIEHDGKRRVATLPDGRSSRIQFYRVNPDVVVQGKEKAEMCSRLGIDAARVEALPFDVTPAVTTFFMVQQALRGVARGARFESARTQRYGVQPASTSPTGSTAHGQLDFGFGLA